MSFSKEFDTPAYKGKVSINTKLFINNEWVDPVNPETVDVIDPSNGEIITKVSVGSSADVDIAVKVARKAFKTTWGLNCPGFRRGELMNKWANLVEQNIDEIAALEAIDSGKTFTTAKRVDVSQFILTIRYYAGWAGKTYGKTIESHHGISKFAYTREEPIGVCAQIIPWNYPLMMAAWKIGPALATGCAIIMKPSENTPLSLLRVCDLFVEAGFPPGAFNVINGYGNTVGQSLAEHFGVDKIAFTGSTLVGRKITKAAADSNLKAVSLELGGKSPNIILDDADLDQAIKWASEGIFGNAGQTCGAGSRLFLQEGIYDKFLEGMTAFAKARKLGSQFELETQQGPQVSKIQLDRVLGFIESGKKDGATVHIGGNQFGETGYFVEPTIFTDVKPEMAIVREEIFGPVVVVHKFKTDAEVIELANNSAYGLGSAVFSESITRALKIAHAMEAGTAFINCYGVLESTIPFGGYKTSGWGRDLGEHALKNYMQTKAVHVNLGA